jgi:hypothetical protein
MDGTGGRHGRVAGSPDDLPRAGRAPAADLGQAPGFVACAVLDTDGGGGASVGLFERRADPDAAGRRVARRTTVHHVGRLPHVLGRTEEGPPGASARALVVHAHPSYSARSRGPGVPAPVARE